MSDFTESVTCSQHGKSFATFVCQHIAHGDSVGFFYGGPEDDPRPDAWCAECDQRLMANDSEWNDETTELAGITLLCAGCYDIVRLRNEVPHKRIKPNMRPTIEDDGWELNSARRQNQLYPNTFEIPSEDELQNLQSGDLVKLLFLFAVDDESVTKIHCERMWVNITAVADTGYIGELGNEPTLSTALKLQDTIHFNRERIASVFNEELSRIKNSDDQDSGIRQNRYSVNRRYC